MPELPTVTQEIAAILDEHYPAPVWCKCGWKAPLSLNDTGSDRRQTLWHVATEVASLVEKREVTVTHGAPQPGSGLTSCCHRPVFELPHTDRITVTHGAVTCGVES